MCNQDNAIPCGVYFGTAYCSRLCEETDFKMHAVLCNDFARLGNPSANKYGDSNALGILFPCEAVNPKLVEIEYNSKVTEKREAMILDPDLGLGLTKPERNPLTYGNSIDRNLIRHFDLHNPLILLHDDNEDENHAKINQSILRMLDGERDKAPWQFRGPVLLLRKPGLDAVSGNTDIEDINLADFRHAVDVMLAVANPELRRFVTADLTPGIKSPGVIINCTGSMQAGAPRFEVAAIPVGHPSVMQAPRALMQVAARLGIILGIHMLPTVEDPDEIIRHNRTATVLLADWKTKGDDFGKPWPVFRHPLGDMLVVRPDEGIIDPRLLDALWQYTEEKLVPLYLQQDRGPKLEKRVALYLQRTVFDNWFDKYRIQYAEGHPRETAIPDFWIDNQSARERLEIAYTYPGAAAAWAQENPRALL